MPTAASVELPEPAAQRLRAALEQLAQQQDSDAMKPPTASMLCELAGVSRNALYRYHAEVLHDLHKLQRRRRRWRDPGPTKRALQQLREENDLLRHRLAMVAALVDHYFAASQEARTQLERREREVAELRRNIKPKVVSIQR